MARVRRLGPIVGGLLMLFCIHCVNRVYGTLVVTSWTCYGALLIVVSLLLLLLLYTVVNLLIKLGLASYGKTLMMFRLKVTVTAVYRFVLSSCVSSHVCNHYRAALYAGAAKS